MTINVLSSMLCGWGRIKYLFKLISQHAKVHETDLPGHFYLIAHLQYYVHCMWVTVVEQYSPKSFNFFY